MTKADDEYLREAMRDTYTDYTQDPDALPAFQRLEAGGFLRVSRDGPAWRIFQSNEQHNNSRKRLGI